MKYVTDIPRKAMEVFNMLPEGTLCEVIDNTLYMSPSPTTQHQQLLTDLSTDLNYFVRQHALGKVLVAPCDVYLNDEHNVVQPDLLFIKKDRVYIIEKKGIIGAPDLVIEILSTNKTHDQERKLDLYERNAIPEYIIIDPDTKQVWHYLMQDGKYLLQKDTLAGKLTISQLKFEVAF